MTPSGPILLWTDTRIRSRLRGLRTNTATGRIIRRRTRGSCRDTRRANGRSKARNDIRDPAGLRGVRSGPAAAPIGPCPFSSRFGTLFRTSRFSSPVMTPALFPASPSGAVSPRSRWEQEPERTGAAAESRPSPSMSALLGSPPAATVRVGSAPGASACRRPRFRRDRAEAAAGSALSLPAAVRRLPVSRAAHSPARRPSLSYGPSPLAPPGPGPASVAPVPGPAGIPG
jgi:hypothetical protein